MAVPDSDRAPAATADLDGAARPGVLAESEAPESAIVIDQLRADRDWLAAQGVELAQFGPDPGSGQVRVYLVQNTERARQLLTDRYGSAIVVDEESRSWRFT